MTTSETPLAREPKEGMGESYGGRRDGASVRSARHLVRSLPGVRDATGAPLEATDSHAAVPARVVDAAPLEAPSAHGRAPAPATSEGFAAFLDGIQRTHVVAYLEGMIPVVHATVAAVVRERRGRTLHTWGTGPRILRELYLPTQRVAPEVLGALQRGGFRVVDTSPDDADLAHPLRLVAAARLRVQERREALESACADDWCARGPGPLYVDGGIGAFAEASRHPHAVGVVKSHRTLYGEGGAAARVADLPAGRRSAAFLIAPRGRTTVASWYLRLRDGAGDPLAGLVRVEVAEGTFSPARADAVSAWILREREPVSLPDSRWRVMAYGIRDCEEYLRALVA